MSDRGFALRLGPLGLHLRGEIDQAELPRPAWPFVDTPRAGDLVVETKCLPEQVNVPAAASDARAWRGERRGDHLSFAAMASPAGPALATATLGPSAATLLRRAEDRSHAEPAWFNPLLQVLVAHAAPRWQGLLLHAACVNLGGRAWLLAGRSGAGKSTLASALVACGAEILAEDRALVFAGARPVACGTPWGGEPGRKQAGALALGGILFLRHAGEDAVFPLAPAAASAQLLAVSLGLFWDRAMLDAAVSLAAGLASAGLCWSFHATMTDRAPACLLELSDSLRVRRPREAATQEVL